MSENAQKAAFARLIARAGGPAALAQAMGLTRGRITHYRTEGMPAHRCRDAEALFGIPREELRPEIFGPISDEERAEARRQAGLLS